MSRMEDGRLPATVRIGGMSASALKTQLGEQGVQLNKAAEALFDDPRLTTLGQARVVEIVAVSVGELGFAEGALYEQIVARAGEAGLVECPLELGPHLRLQFMAQPAVPDGTPPTRHRAPTGSLTIASAPLDDADERPWGFYLRRAEGVTWLRGYWSWSGHLWSPEDVLVFEKATAP